MKTCIDCWPLISLEQAATDYSRITRWKWPIDRPAHTDPATIWGDSRSIDTTGASDGIWDEKTTNWNRMFTKDRKWYIANDDRDIDLMNTIEWAPWAIQQREQGTSWRALCRRSIHGWQWLGWQVHGWVGEGSMHTWVNESMNYPIY